MAEQQFADSFRDCLWQTHGERCLYCENPLDFMDVIIDHVIPERLLNEPEELERVRKEYGLGALFDVRSEDNLAPCCSRCNGKKGGTLFPGGFTAILLTKLKDKRDELKKCRERKQSIRKLGNLLRSIGRSIENEVFSKDQLREALVTKGYINFFIYSKDLLTLPAVNLSPEGAGVIDELPVIFSRQAFERLNQRNVSIAEVVETLEQGVTVESLSIQHKNTKRHTYKIRSVNGLVVIYEIRADAFFIITTYWDQNVFEALSDVKKSLDAPMASVPYRIVADSDNKFTILATEKDAAERVPFTVKTKFRFDTKTEEGKLARDRFLDHIKKGTPVQIDGENIEIFDLPEFLPDFMKPTVTKEAKLILEPRRPDITVPLRIERVLTNGEKHDTGRLDFEVVNVGTSELTLKNDRQKSPLQATLTMNKEELTFNLNIQCRLGGFNVHEHLKSLEFFVAMSKEGQTSIYRTDAEIPIVESNEWRFHLEDNFDANIAVLKALALIQKETKTYLVYPERRLTDQEINDIFAVESIITEGKVTVAPQDIKVDVSRKIAEDQLDRFAEEESIRITGTFPDAGKYRILGTPIDLGPAVLTADATMSSENFELCKARMSEGTDSIECTFSLPHGAGVLDFLNWESDDRHTRLQITGKELGSEPKPTEPTGDVP